MQRRKGATGERELAALLREHLGDTAIGRNLQQTRDGGHDLTGPALDAFAIEVKRAAEPKLSAWWAQACEQAGGRVPVLAYRLDRQPWRFMVPLGALHHGFRADDLNLTATVGLMEFCAVVREALPATAD